jgi:uncharacterized protein YdeI (YjbR/CyaY-like superfamily)
MELHNNIKAFYANMRKEWRKWLVNNSEKEKSVWLIIYHKGSNTKSVSYEEAVEEALCFGWIDSIAKKRDNESKYQYFSPRREKSNWSKSNRELVDKLITQGLMTPSRAKLIEIAKKTGTWETLVDVQNSVIPPDLQELLDKNKIEKKNFLTFPPSSKRVVLEWILNAKKAETRQKRIEETVRLAKDNIKANHFGQ